MLQALLLGITAVQAADVVVFGDSWGTYGKKEFAAEMAKHGLTTDNVAVGGTTAAGWAKDEYALKNTLDRNPDCKYVWLTIGINDIIPKMIGNADIQSVATQLIADTKVFLDIALAAHPNVKIVQFGYDLLNWKNNNILCTIMGTTLTSASCGSFPSIQCQNELIAQIQYLYVDEISKYYPQHYSVDMLGTLQAAAGVSGATIGSPAWAENSPAQYMDATCIHLNPAGYAAFFEALWNVWFAPQE